MADMEALSRLIEPELKSLGYDLVRVAFIGGTSDPTLQVMAERPDTRQLILTAAAALISSGTRPTVTAFLFGSHCR